MIAKGKQTFVEVGLALAEIRDLRLYKREYGSFSEYCREKWGWERRYTDYVIAGAEAVKSLPEKVSTIVLTETAARELAKIPAEQRAEVVETVAAEGKPVTAAAIKRRLPPPPMRRRAPGGTDGTSGAVPPPPGQVLDATGWPIPTQLIPLWQRAGEVQEWLTGTEPTEGGAALGPGEAGHAVRGGPVFLRAVASGATLDGHEDGQAVCGLSDVPGPGPGQVHAVPWPGADFRVPLEHLRDARGQGVSGAGETEV